jgi:23S rRNA pseudouridine1911/1915/1917 synthase
LEGLKDLAVIYEDNHLIAVSKQPGQPVQPEPGKPVSLEEEVKEYLKKKYEKSGEVFLGVIHRLDMPVSGIVLFARTSKALVRMNELFQARKIEKYYVAKVQHRPPAEKGLLVNWLKRDENKNFTKAFTSEVSKGLKAELSYELLRSSRTQALLKLQLHTGRKHQIRAQLSAAGCPIAGDIKYGATSPLKNGMICLHAAELVFEHPVKKEILRLLAPLPVWSEEF